MQSDLIPIPPFIEGVLERAGVDLGSVLRRIGGVARPADDNRLRVSTAQFFALWRAVEQAGVPDDFGLRLSEAPATHQLDVASTAALLSDSFGEALSRLARYKRLTCPEDIDVELSGNEVRVGYRWLHAGEAAPALLIDAAFAWLYRLAATGAGKPIKLMRLELTRVEAREAQLRRHFDCPVRFNCTHDVMVFAKAALETPFVTHHPDMLELMSPGLEAALHAHSASQSLSQQVRHVLSKTMRGKRPSVEQVARELLVSSRTLQRRLEDEGTSYQRLLDEVRQRTARHLLSTTDLETGEIAFVLGFEELNSFTRAFQGWEGTSPHRWRALHVDRASNAAVQ